jgi:hypothetical protein
MNLHYNDSAEVVKEKLSLTEEQSEKLRLLGEQSISDQEMYDEASNLIGREKANLYMIWLGVGETFNW